MGATAGSRDWFVRRPSGVGWKPISWHGWLLLLTAAIAVAGGAVSLYFEHWNWGTVEAVGIANLLIIARRTGHSATPLGRSRDVVWDSGGEPPILAERMPDDPSVLDIVKRFDQSPAEAGKRQGEAS